MPLAKPVSWLSKIMSWHTSTTLSWWSKTMAWLYLHKIVAMVQNNVMTILGPSDTYAPLIHSPLSFKSNVLGQNMSQLLLGSNRSPTLCGASPQATSFYKNHLGSLSHTSCMNPRNFSLISSKEWIISFRIDENLSMYFGVFIWS